MAGLLNPNPNDEAGLGNFRVKPHPRSAQFHTETTGLGV